MFVQKNMSSLHDEICIKLKKSYTCTYWSFVKYFHHICIFLFYKPFMNYFCDNDWIGPFYDDNQSKNPVFILQDQMTMHRVGPMTVKHVTYVENRSPVQVR